MCAGGRRAVLVAALAVGAAVYFALGMGLGIEWFDEGHLVYPSWRVGQGEVPHRDFRQLYPPAVFYLNGALFRLVAADLFVVRVSLVALRTLIAVLVYVLARRVARPSVALLVWVLFVAVWGSPLWVFNTPYANHYTVALGLLGLIVLLRRPWAPFTMGLVTGLCSGLAFTFKQTAGVFTLLTALLFVVSTTPPGRVDCWTKPAWLVGIGVLVGAVALSLAYVTPLSWPHGVLVAPVLLAVGVVGVRDEVRGWLRANGRWRLLAVAGCGAGMLVGPLGIGVPYATLGELGSLVRDTLSELPLRMRWFVPLSWSSAAGAGVFRILLWLPVLVAFFALPAVWDPRRMDDGRARARALFAWNAAVSLLALHPCADFPHALMILPMVLPALAGQADRLVTRGAVGALLLLTAGTVALAAPLVRGLAAERQRRPPSAGSFAHATRIWSPDPRFEGGQRLVVMLDTRWPRDVPLLVLPSEQMTYFLAGRETALPLDEYTFYLLTADLLSAADAHALSDEQAMIARLDERRPILVERTRDGGGAERIRTAFPTLGAYLATHYRSKESIATYMVSAWGPPDGGLPAP